MELKSGTNLQGNRYRILRTLGQGGFGITYLAEQVMGGRRVCIKEYFPRDYYNRDANTNRVYIGSQVSTEEMNKYKDKFSKEANVLAKLKHPHIVPVYDVFEENDTVYYVMEYIEGQSLGDMVKQQGALSEAEALRYIREIASALGYIHDQKINHLDVKPSNIMVSQANGIAILIDFGLSKHYDTSGGQTSSTPVGISHGYAPIEQYQPSGVSTFSPATDIYSLGATLYYLVTGDVPPQATVVGEDGITLPTNISATTRKAIERSMSFWRKDRPQSIMAFLAMLNDSWVAAPKPMADSETTKVSPKVYDETTAIKIESKPHKKSTTKPQPKPTPQQTNTPIAKEAKQAPAPKKKPKRIWLSILLLAAVVVGCITYYMYGKTKIYYTTSDGKALEEMTSEKFDALILSHSYENGQGVIEFWGDVTVIGENAFEWCETLTSITIPDSVTDIRESAFRFCSSLTNITIPSSVSKIGDYAFWGCDGLLDITISEGVTRIGDEVFRACGSLTNVTIPDSIVDFGGGTFSACSNLREFNGKLATQDGRCLIINNELVAFAPAGLTSYTIPNSVTKIGDGAFSFCSELTNIVIPNSVTIIGDYAFASSDDIIDIAIPDSVTEIGERAFEDCRNLTNITIPNSVTRIGNGALSWCNKLTKITIPDSVTTMGDGVFTGCENLKQFNGKFASKDRRCLIVDNKLVAFAPAGLTTYTIPNGVTTIGYETFMHRAELTKIVIPDSVTEFEEMAFWGCKGLTDIAIPNNVTKIGNGAFGMCEGLTNVTIPDSVTEIEERVFTRCPNIKNFNGKFSSQDGKCLIVNSKLVAFAPMGITKYTIPDGVTSIGESTFSSCDYITNITIPKGVTIIGKEAFVGCDNLSNVTIPEGVTHIGYGAFLNCSALYDITIPNSVTKIEDVAFEGCYDIDLYTKQKIWSININAT